MAWTIPAGTSRDVLQDSNYPCTINLPFEQNRGKRKVKAMLVPAKVIDFIEDKNNETYALVYSCWHYRRKVSVITYRWQLEFESIKISKQANTQYNNNVLSTNLVPVYHKVSINCIQKHCLIILFEIDGQYKMEINNPSLWAEAFLTV